MKNAITIRRRLGILILVVTLLLIGCYLFVEHSTREVVMILAESKIQSMSNVALGQAVIQAMQEETDSKNLVDIRFDEQGKIRMVQSNATAMNKLSARVLLLAQEKMDQIEHEVINIPLGSAMQSLLFANRGPNIPVRIMPNTNLEADYVTSYESGGINQTHLCIYLRLKASFGIASPTSSRETNVTVQMLVCENIIVGDVPNMYFNMDNQEDIIKLKPMIE